MSEQTPPVCPDCRKPMQENKSSGNEQMKQYICGCTGVVFHLNIHKGQGSH